MKPSIKTDPGETAAYIERMLAELGDLAKSHELTMLVYLMEMARLEAVSRSMDAPK
jgi:hypothetical protein